MIQGTTPTHTFNTSISLAEAIDIEITYAQGDVIVIKKKADCVITDKQITTELTQEETFKFKTFGYKAEAQITAKWASDKPEGKVLKSNIMTVDVSRSLKRGVI